MKSVRRIVAEYGKRESMLIPILQDIQKHKGYVPEQDLSAVAFELDVPLSRLYSLITFYRAFRLSPKGRHAIHACLGTACHVKGGDRVLDVLKQTLGVEPGETTTDNRFTLEVVRCVGCCGLAPVVVVDDDFHGKMNLGKVKKILKAYG